MSYLIKVAYDGSKFYGFQRLNEEISDGHSHGRTSAGDDR